MDQMKNLIELFYAVKKNKQLNPMLLNSDTFQLSQKYEIRSDDFKKRANLDAFNTPAKLETQEGERSSDA